MKPSLKSRAWAKWLMWKPGKSAATQTAKTPLRHLNSVRSIAADFFRIVVSTPNFLKLLI